MRPSPKETETRFLLRNLVSKPLSQALHRTIVTAPRTQKPGFWDREQKKPGFLVLFALLAFATSCSLVRTPAVSPPFRTRFGVAVGDVDVTAKQLDALGAVWYMDYRWKTPTLTGHERLYTVRCWEVEADRGAIAAAMRASGSAWWSLGNEPNDPAQDNVTPEQYAALYAAFEQWAQGAPQCRIVPAGIANVDWNWAQAFREAFRSSYGRYPRVDAWNVHNYILEASLDPYDVAEFQRRILAFRRWMETIGEGRKPLLLTEFGVLYGNGCCRRPVDPPQRLEDFMRDAVGWLTHSQAVTSWAWFATYADVFNGNLMTHKSELTDLGMLYRNLIRDNHASLDF